MKRLGFLLAAIFASALPAQAANICVTGASPTAGCDSSYSTLQLAINAAALGDTVYAAKNVTYTGPFILPVKSGTGFVTIRSDADDSLLPGLGVRLDPTRDPSLLALLPKFIGAAGGDATMKAAAGAHGYRFQFVEFAGNPQGYAEELRWGSNDCGPSPAFCQEYVSQEPTDMIADRIYMHGDKLSGQKRGITVGGQRLIVTSSTLVDFAGLGQDAQAIGGSNGSGPLTIINNHIEASTENILIGGDDPQEETDAIVTGTPTTTSAIVTIQNGRTSGNAHTISEWSVGQFIAVLVKGGTDRDFTTIRSISGTGTTGSITFDPIPDVPDVPGDIVGGVVLNGMTVQGNYFTKPLSYLYPIIDQGVLNSAQPTNVTTSTSTASGSLPAGPYTYYIQSYNSTGYVGNNNYANPTVAVTASLSAPGTVTLNWTASANSAVDHYKIYGRSATPSRYWTVTTSAACTGTTCTFSDTGTSGTTTSSISKASYWQLKNLFEIKAVRNANITGNIFEYQWAGSDIGYATWTKSVNQGLKCEFCQSRDILYQDNIWRHVDGWFEVSGAEYIGGGNDDRVGPLTNLTVRNNLVYDSNSNWALSKGGSATSQYAISIQNGSVNTIFDRNTIIHTSKGLIALGKATNLKFTNNLGRHETYGVLGSGSSDGTTSLNLYAPGAVFTANAMAGASASKYPAGNFGPSVATWEGEFNNYTFDGSDNANGPVDYHLRSDSDYVTSATDGGPIGANIDTILAATANVMTGGASTVATPPTITSTAIDTATVGSAYTFTLQGSGTGALSWAVTTGSLPSGFALDGATGVISNSNPTTAGSTTFTVTVTDATTSLTASQQLTLVVNASFIPVSISTASPLPAGAVGSPYHQTFAASDGRPPFTWSVSSGVQPAGLTISADGVIDGTPTTPGTSTFTMRVAGSLGTAATKAFSLTIATASLPADRPDTQGPIPQQTAHFAGPIAPTAATSGCCRVGDSWVDTSKNPPEVNIVSTLSPLTWVASSSRAATQAFLSATDAVPATLQPGDTFEVNSSGKVTNIPIGTGVWTADGVSAGWANSLNVSLLTGTLSNALFPTTVNIGTRVNVPQVGITQYAVFQDVADPGASAAGFTRLYMDSADHLLKARINGGSAVTLGTGGTGGVGQFEVAFSIPTTTYTQQGTLASGTQELFGSSRQRDIVDLTGYTSVRLFVRLSTVANAGAAMSAQYSLDSGTTWVWLDGSTGPSVAINSGSQLVSSWVSLDIAAKTTNVMIRIVLTGGDGSTNPAFGAIRLQFK